MALLSRNVRGLVVSSTFRIVHRALPMLCRCSPGPLEALGLLKLLDLHETYKTHQVSAEVKNVKTIHNFHSPRKYWIILMIIYWDTLELLIHNPDMDE